MIGIETHRNTQQRYYQKHQNSPQKRKKAVSIVKLPSVKQAGHIQYGNYTLGDVVGEGSFAKVRTCVRKTDGQQLVIKIFEKFRLYTQEKRRGTVKQIDILKCIKHPNIIKIVDSFQTADTINIVMEKFSLTSLAVFARENRPFTDESLRLIVRQISEAIRYLHNKKIAHRDIKPENILINTQNEIKLIDLGLSMMGDHTQMKVAGTPYYMSPELLNKKNYEPFKADIWAFGILLYWLTLGYFPQDNQEKKKKKGKAFQLKFPVDMHPGIEYLITKMLNEDPFERVGAEQILQDTWVKPKDFRNEISKLKNMSKG